MEFRHVRIRLSHYRITVYSTILHLNCKIVLRLLAFNYSELREERVSFGSSEELIYKGFYSGIYDKGISPVDFFPSYIENIH